MPAFLLLGYSFWVPQIVHSAQRDTTDGLSNFYVFGTTLSRLFLPLYFFGCPYNFLNLLQPLQPEFGLCALLAGWVGLQLAVVMLQRKLGPRFFIPARFLPEKYDYYRPVRITQPGRVEADPSGASRRRPAAAGAGYVTAVQRGECGVVPS